MPDNHSKITSTYLKLRARLAHAVLGIVPPKEIEDIIQETYVRACQATTTKSIEKPEGYLFRIARNLALDHAKRAETRLSLSDDEVDEEVIAEAAQSSDPTIDDVISNDRFADLCDAVRRLPLQQRRAFVMKKVYGYSQREIAADMQISEKTVERHISLGMERCMEYMSRNEELMTGGATRKGREAREKPRTGDQS